MTNKTNENLFFALPISPIGRIGLISLIFSSCVCAGGVPLLLLGIVFDTREGGGCVPLVGRVSFSIPICSGGHGEGN